MKPPKGVTKPQRRRFLDELAAGKTVKDAAELAGRERTAFYRARGADADFAAAWEEAYDDGTDILEREAQRRAVDGVEDFKMAGDQVVPVQRYSDTLLIFLLKARRPGKFRDNVQVQHTGPAGGPVQVEHQARLTLGDVAQFARTLE